MEELERAQVDLLSDDRPLRESLSVGEFTHKATSGPAWCRFLHVLTRRLQATSIVEMGTAVGMSGTALASAQPSHGRLWTIDFDEASVAVARSVFDRVGVRVNTVVGLIEEVLESVLGSAAPVDLMFIDANHREGPTQAYFEQAVPHLSRDAVVVFDDIHWSDGMERAWTVLRADSRFAFTIDRGRVGIAGIK